jgi:hypothetical protein
MQMANSFVSPNLYQLHGRGLHVTYSTTGIEGKPHFSYQDSHGAKAFSGDQIALTRSPIGTLVTVVLRVTPDAGSTSFSVLIPVVNLSSKALSAPVHTNGVTTIQRSSIAPVLDLGQIQTYHVSKLSGTASQVEP